MTIDPN